jgi:hypothetical protein
MTSDERDFCVSSSHTTASSHDIPVKPGLDLTSSLEEKMGIRFRNKVIKERIIHQWKFKRRIFQYDKRYHPPQLEEPTSLDILDT